MARVQVDCTTGGKTHQCFKDECDINLIMKKFMKYGKLPNMIKKNPIYGDFSAGLDYQKALELITKAEEQFMNIPSEVRFKFDNDPKKFLDFANNPDNEKMMIEMGLKVDPKKPVSVPDKNTDTLVDKK